MAMCEYCRYRKTDDCQISKVEDCSCFQLDWEALPKDIQAIILLTIYDSLI